MRLATAKREKAIMKQKQLQQQGQQEQGKKHQQISPTQSSSSATAPRRLTDRRKKKLSSSSNHRVGRNTGSKSSTQNYNQPTIADIPNPPDNRSNNPNIDRGNSNIHHSIGSCPENNESQLVVKSSDLSIQSAERRPVVLELASCRLLSATVLPIQRLVRRYVGRRRAHRRRDAVLRVQGSVRSWLVRILVRRRSRAATRIQASIRRRRATEDLAVHRTAAVMIQSATRGFLAWTHFQCDLLDVMIVQSVVRRKLAQHRFREVRWNRAVPLIRSGLNIMGLEVPSSDATEFQLPPDQVLVQWASWLTSLQVPAKGGKI